MSTVTNILTIYMDKPIIENTDAMLEMLQTLDNTHKGYYKLEDEADNLELAET